MAGLIARRVNWKLRIKDWISESLRRNRRSSVLNYQFLLFIFLFPLLLTSCTAVPPVEKIGLIAPFEGLYRRSGYAALAATRAALTDADIDANVTAVIPLALDNLADPDRTQRSAEKLMVDPAVGAVIGPLAPAMSAGARDVLRDASLWIAPYAIDPAGGFADPATATAWADELVAAIGAAVRAQGQSQLVLAGWTPGWPEYSVDEWRAIAGMPVLLLAVEDGDVDVIQADDAVLWLGNPADGARYLMALRSAQLNLPFWLGPQGGDPVFDERFAGALDRVYWAIWSPVEYNNSYDAPNFPDAPAAQLVYLATRDALDRMAGSSATRVSADRAPTWQIQFFSFAPDGSLNPYSAVE